MYIENIFRDLDLLFNENNYQNFLADVKKEGDGFVIIGELPGIKKEDIDINYENEILSISANLITEDDETYIIKQRKNKKLRKTFSLGDVDEDTIKAKLEDGLLYVRFSLKNKSNQKKTIVVE